LYTIADLNQGVGVFDHVMRRAGEYPSRHTDMPGQVAIGFIAAAMQSGLDAEEITEVIESYFDDQTAKLLRTVRNMYAGKDRRIHLWDEEQKKWPHRAFGPYLRGHARPSWQIDRDPFILPDPYAA
jgi:hypothetical protein